MIQCRIIMCHSRSWHHGTWNKDSQYLEIQLSQVSRGTAALEFALCEISLKNKLAYLVVLANRFSLLASPLAKVLNQYGHLSKAMYKLKAQKEEESEAGPLTAHPRQSLSWGFFLGMGGAWLCAWQRCNICLLLSEVEEEQFGLHTFHSGKFLSFSLYVHIFPANLLCCVVSRSVVSNSLPPHGLEPTGPLCPWGFSRQEYWSGLPCPPPGDLPNPGIEPMSPALQTDSFFFFFLEIQAFIVSIIHASLQLFILFQNREIIALLPECQITK